MFGDKKYKDGFKDASEIAGGKFRKMGKEQKENNERWEDLVMKAASPLKRKKLQKEIIKTKKQNRKKFDIKIVNENNEKYADDVRIILNHLGNAAFCVTYKSFRNQASGTVDYTIFLGDMEQEIKKIEKVLLDEQGCYFAVADNQIILKNNPGAIKSSQAFLKYYQSVVGKDEIEYEEELEKIIDAENYSVKSFDIVDEYSMYVEKLADKSGKLESLVLGTNIPVVIGLGSVAIVSGVSEILCKETVRRLKKKFDRDTIQLAQRQILEIKLCDYIEEQQIKYAMR